MKLIIDVNCFPKFSWGQDLNRWRNGSRPGPCKYNASKIRGVVDLFGKKLRERMLRICQILSNDLGGGEKISYSGCKKVAGEQNSITMEQKMRDANVAKFVKDGLRIVKENFTEVGLSEIAEEIVNDIQKNVDQYIETWNSYIMKLIMRSIERRVEEKCKKEVQVMNFMDTEVPKELLAVLKHGRKVVPSFALDPRSTMTNLEEDILSYLNKYRRLVEGRRKIQRLTVKEWLEEAIDEAVGWEFQDSHSKFYMRVRDELKIVKKMVWGRINNEKCLTSVEEVTKLVREVKGGVIVEADKNFGWCLMPCRVMEEAENRMVEGELGGVFVEETSVGVIRKIDANVVEFEENLEPSQLEVLNRFCIDRRIPVEDVVLPFLKLNLKLHKISKEDLRTRNFPIFKFRPVQDSVSSSFVKYSHLLMLMTRELNEKVKSRVPKLKELDSLSGVEFSRKVKTMEIPGVHYRLLVSGDFDSAYTNCTLKDALRAYVVLCKFIEAEDYQMKLLMKLAVMILEGNYVENVAGIYHLNSTLPMGCSSSG